MAKALRIIKEYTNAEKNKERFDRQSPSPSPPPPLDSTSLRTSETVAVEKIHNRFSLDALRAEMDAKVESILAQLAANEARFSEDRNNHEDVASISAPNALQKTLKTTHLAVARKTQQVDIAKKVLSRVDEVASPLAVKLDEQNWHAQQRVDLETRLRQLRQRIIVPDEAMQ